MQLPCQENELNVSLSLEIETNEECEARNLFMY